MEGNFFPEEQQVRSVYKVTLYDSLVQRIGPNYIVSARNPQSLGWNEHLKFLEHAIEQCSQPCHL